MEEIGFANPSSALADTTFLTSPALYAGQTQLSECRKAFCCNEYPERYQDAEMVPEAGQLILYPASAS